MKPRPVRIEGDIAYVPLTQGYEAIIDASDVHLVENHNWWAEVKQWGVSAARSIREPYKTNIYMHRVIMNAPAGSEVDHKDHNTLNNRRSNLRFCTSTQNSQNTRLRCDNTSGYKGVSWCKLNNKWKAQIAANGANRYIGLFDCPKKAHEAYIKAAKKHFGEFFNSK